MNKNLYIKTYGCQMNVYDSQKMAALLSPHGFNVVESPDDANLIILNTCHIREKAAEKMYSELGRIRKIKDKNDAMICVAGCVGQAEGEYIFKRAPFVDIVVGPQSYQKLPELVEKAKREKKWQINLDFTPNDKFDKLNIDSSAAQVSSFLSIQEGCDKFCHFCVVPYTRGAEYSRPVVKIYNEALKLVANGSKEITLLGQNVSSYHGEYETRTCSLGKLIKKLAMIDGLERIRYITSHPKDMVCDELFEAHADIEKLMPYLHLPVQTGSNKLLKAMNRKHDRDFYLKIITKFRKIRSDMAFSSDFIVGYPGETEADFIDTMNLVKEVNYSQCYSFKYSIRPGTPAAGIEDQVPEEVKNERLYRLQELLLQQQNKFNQSFEGKILPVLLEKSGKKANQLIGRSPYMHQVIVNASDRLKGDIVDILISDSNRNNLKGELILYDDHILPREAV